MERHYKYVNFPDHQDANTATSQGTTTAYGMSAMRSELDLIDNQKSLYDGARRLGQLVASHQIDEAELTQALYRVANANGIDRPNHHILRGLQHGKAKPRVVKAQKDYKGSHEWAKTRKLEIQEYVEVVLGNPETFGAIKGTELKVALALCIQMQKAGCTKIKAAAGYVAMNAGVDLDTVYSMIKNRRLEPYGFEIKTSEIPGQKTSWHLKASKMINQVLAGTSPGAAKRHIGLSPAMGNVLGNSFNDKENLFYPGHNAWSRHHNGYKLFLLLADQSQVGLKDLRQAAGIHEDTVRSEMKYLVEVGIAELAEVLETERGKPKFYRLTKTSFTPEEEATHSIADRRTKTVERMTKSRNALNEWRKAYQENRKRTRQIIKRRQDHKAGVKSIKTILQESSPGVNLDWDLLRYSPKSSKSQGLNVSQNNLQ